MPKDLELIVYREAIELEHDRRIKRGDVAMPDVARDAGEENVGVTAFKPAHHRHLRNAMALPEIFAEKERVDPGGVAAHDHILVVVGKNLRLDEVARAQEIGDRSRLAHRTEGALAVAFRIIVPGALQFLAGQLRDLGGLSLGQNAAPHRSARIRSANAFRRRKTARARKVSTKCRPSTVNFG